MASIPLPALHVNPPEDPSVGIQRAIQLKSLLNQQALFPGQLQQQEQQIQSTNLENQLRQQQVKDSQTLQSLAPNYLKKDSDGKPIGFDYDGFAADAQSKGVSPSTMAQLTTVRKNAADTALANANAGKATLESQDKLNDQAFSHLEGIRGETDPVKRQTKWLAAMQWATQNSVQGAQQLPQQAPDDKGLNSVELTLGFHKQALADAKEQADIAKTGAEAQKTQMEADFMKKYGGNPQMMESRYVALKANQAQGQKLSTDDTAFLKGYEAQKKIIPVANFNLQNAGVTGQGGQPSAMAQMVATGQAKWSDVISPRTPMSVKQAFAQEVKSINPNFNSGDFQVEQKVREKFTSGNVSDQLMAINTAREHMKTFGNLADALDNGNVQLANKIGNYFGVQFGSDKATNFKIAAQAFGGEVGKAFDGARVTEGERKSASDAFNSNMSPAQFRGAIKTVDALLAGKQKAAQQSYQSGRQGQPNFGENQQNTNPQESDFFTKFGGQKH